METRKEFEVIYYVSDNEVENSISNETNTLIFELFESQSNHNFGKEIGNTFNYCRVRTGSKIMEYLEKVIIPINPITKPAIIPFEGGIIHVIPIFNAKEFNRLEQVATLYISAQDASSESTAFFEAISESERTRNYRYCDVTGNFRTIIFPRIKNNPFDKRVMLLIKH